MHNRIGKTQYANGEFQTVLQAKRNDKICRLYNSLKRILGFIKQLDNKS